MSVLVVHLSDAHLKSNSDPLIARLPNLARAIGSEFNASVKAILIAFTGDAVDKGSILAFEVAKSFFTRLREEVQTITACITHILMIPGNHDVVQPSDPALRDLAIANLTKGEMSTRPQASFEQVVLDPLNRYFELAKACDASSPTPENPYYVTVDKTYEGHTIRVHLLNTAWMCTRGQHPGDLLFPLDELGNVPHANSVDYELSLLHHPFHWFKQPEIMRNLREKIESRSDMILTGHEHVGRSLVQKTFGKGENEYHEGEALQDGDAEVRSGFHVLKIDFENDRQILSTYLWKEANGIGAYHHENNLLDAPLTRNDSKITLINRFKHSFEVMLSDPELPIQHPKNGKLTLGEFFTYPDVKLKDDGDEIQKPRIKGGDVLGIVVSQKRSLFLGPDRCGKSSFAKRLCFDLHACGHLPLFVSGETLAHAKADNVIRLLNESISKQFETLEPDDFWQSATSKRIIVIDDLQKGPTDRALQNDLYRDIEARFDHVVFIGSDDFYYEELLSIQYSDRAANVLWNYPCYRILPFGYLRRQEFVTNWVALDRSLNKDDVKQKADKINHVMNHFLRTNAIPQYPWVVLIIVQTADSSSEPLHAENGSYAYLLQALITAALAKSRVTLPIGGKYTWLSELASELYRKNVPLLTDVEARIVHEKYKTEYGVSTVDYKEIRDDMVCAGVLRVENDDISFRQPYTFCYFVARHLASRLNSGRDNDSVRSEIKALWADLYHEDTANVLVFLAHLTTSSVATDEMKQRASELFQWAFPTDFVTDTAQVSALCQKPGVIVLPPGDPVSHKKQFHDEQDDAKADTDSRLAPRRGVILKPQDRANEENETRSMIVEIVTAMRAIDVLGQVLRNEATARKVDTQVEIANEIFTLGRRLLGFLFATVNEHLEEMVRTLTRQYSAEAIAGKQVDPLKHKEKANWHIFSLYSLAAFSVIKRVAAAVRDPNLKEVFRRIVDEEPNLANRVYSLAINIDSVSADTLLRQAEELNDEVTGKSKKKGEQRSFNNFARTIIRAIIADYLYLNHVAQPVAQALCAKLDIRLPTAAHDPKPKGLPRKKRN